MVYYASHGYDVDWRRERLLAGARPRKHTVPLRQRAGLKLVQLGLAVAGRLTVSSVLEVGEAAPQL
jgi:hypothetical protein